MQRFPFRLTCLAALAALAGCSADDVTSPLTGDAARLDGPALAASAPMVSSTTVLFDEFGTGSGISGTATLTRSKDGLWLAVAAENLAPGHAHTIWWVIFDNPHGCKDGCGLDDLGRRSAQATVVNGEGFVADGGGTSAGFETHLDRHDPGGAQLLVGDASGVDNPYIAEVHFIVRSHGEAEADPADLAVQTSTVGGFCNLPPESSDGGCLDVGVGVFPAGTAPGKP